MSNMSMDRMGSNFDRLTGMSGMDMNRGFGGFGGGGGGHMGGGMSDRSSGSKAGCQIFVRNVSYMTISEFSFWVFNILVLSPHISMLTNVSLLQLSYDLTWQKLKEKFSHCGMLFLSVV